MANNVTIPDTPADALADGAKNPVIICGAVPGDPDLITVKGKKGLSSAQLAVCAVAVVCRAGHPDQQVLWTTTGKLSDYDRHLAHGYREAQEGR